MSEKDQFSKTVEFLDNVMEQLDFIKFLYDDARKSICMASQYLANLGEPGKVMAFSDSLTGAPAQADKLGLFKGAVGV